MGTVFYEHGDGACYSRITTNALSGAASDPLR